MMMMLTLQIHQKLPVGFWMNNQEREGELSTRGGLLIDNVLNTDKLHLLERLCDLAPSNDARSSVVITFKYRMQQRRDENMALYANEQDDDDDESEESDEQSDGYISDVILSTEDY
ncbi:hypothetical protein Hanom_Chr15g01378281 [Helianthus anomalus]